MPQGDFYEDTRTPPTEPERAETSSESGEAGESYPPGEQTVAELMESAGVSGLTESSTAESIVAALGKFRAIAGRWDTLWVKAAQSALIKKLKSIKFSAAADTVREVFRVDALAEGGGQGQDVLFPDMEAWPVPVEGVGLANEIRETFERFIILPSGASVALTLWVIHTYAIEAAYHSPFIFLKSPEKRCGKSTALKMLGALVNRPLPTGNISPSALFRAVEKFGPTLLIDEADRALKYNEEITGLLNTSHDRGNAFVIRTVGDDHEPRRFHVFGPKAIAGIGALADTIEDRAIILKMRRRAPGETVKRLRGDRLFEFDHLKEKTTRWVADNLEILKEIDPEMPEQLNDRAMDNWRPLIAIADCVGGAWPSLAREAAKILSCNATGDEDGPGIQLLTDLQTLFLEQNSDRLGSQEITTALHSMEDRPWPEYGRQRKPISATSIARILKRFGICPRQFRQAGGKERGYFLEDFADAFKRYLPDTGIRNGTPGTQLKNSGLQENRNGTGNDGVPFEKQNNLFINNEVPGVPGGNPNTGGEKKEEVIEI